MTCEHWSQTDGFAKATLYAVCPWCEIERLRMRCDALAFLLYPIGDRPREAVAGDLGLRSPQSEPTK